MIPFTRLKGQVIAINPDLIESAEATPDTTLHLTSGDKVIVRESIEEIVELVREYRRDLLAALRVEISRVASMPPPAPTGEHR